MHDDSIGSENVFFRSKKKKRKQLSSPFTCCIYYLYMHYMLKRKKRKSNEQCVAHATHEHKKLTCPRDSRPKVSLD